MKLCKVLYIAGVGQYYKTDINPHPLIFVNDVIFFQPL